MQNIFSYSHILQNTHHIFSNKSFNLEIMPEGFKSNYSSNTVVAVFVSEEFVCLLMKFLLPKQYNFENSH